MKAIVFDLDGTLYDSAGLPFRLIVKELFRGRLRLLAAERKVRRKLAGVDFGSCERLYDEFFKAMEAETGCPAKKARDWYFTVYMKDMVKILAKHFSARQHLDHILDILERQGIKAAAFSDYGCVEMKMQALGIDCRRFALIADSPSFGGLKPSVKSFLALAAELGVEPSEILMVGDRLDTDGAGAIGSGMQFIHLFKNDKAAAKFRRKHIRDSIEHLTWDEFSGKF
ncbi:MAG: HAD family hydrolase [Candidatus Cryptobacteroides sp.]